MSMLHVGQQCSSCALVDFLPFTCPSCSLVFCQSHIQSHPCQAVAGPSRSPPRTFKVVGEGRCEVNGCDRPSIEALGGVGEGGEKIAREVKCGACGGAFCTAHRQQKAHSCSGPNDHTTRQDAAIERKAKAQALLAKNFPSQASKVVPKVGPKKDDTRVRAESPPRLPPSLQPDLGLVPEPPMEKKSKTRAEKMYDIHVRKLRSLAKPLDEKQRSIDEKRFFEWTVDLEGKGIKGWMESGKYEGKLERSWVNTEMPLGRMMDLMVAQTKVARPSSSDPSQMLGLISLCALPDQSRTTHTVDLSKTAASIPEGSIIVLVRGHPG